MIAGCSRQSGAEGPLAPSQASAYGLARPSRNLGVIIVASPLGAAIRVSRVPSGPRIATLPTITDGGPTWVPVIATRVGWYKVELLGPPNGESGWVAASSVRTATDPYSITVNLSTRTLMVYRDGVVVASWPAAIGAPATPTPVGTTYIAGDVSAVGVNAIEAPLLRPLAWHTTSALAASEFPALHTGGQVGVIAIHGWEGENVNPTLWSSNGHGLAVTHGCIRLPARAVSGLLSKVPTGTPVIIQA